MSRGRARAQTVERLEGELEELMAQLQADPAPLPSYPEGGFTLEDMSESRASSQHYHSYPLESYEQEAKGSGSRRGGAKACPQDLDTLLARLDDEERQIKEDIKRMRDAYARTLRREYLTKGSSKSARSHSPTSPSSPPPVVAAHQPPASSGQAGLRKSDEGSEDEAAREQERQLREAEMKVTVLKKRAEEVRKTIMLKGSLIARSPGGSGGSFGRARRQTNTVIGERRGAGGGGGGEETQVEERELRELEARLKRMEQDRDAKEREREEEDRARRREEEGRVRVTLEMAKLLLREEAAKREDEDRREEERKLGEMRDRVERMRIMADVRQRQREEAAAQQRPHYNHALPPSPLTPPSHLPPLSPAGLPMSPIGSSSAAAAAVTSGSPHQPSFAPTSPLRQFYYTQFPSPPSSSPLSPAPSAPSSSTRASSSVASAPVRVMGAAYPLPPRPSVPPLPTAHEAPGAVPRPNFSPRATNSAGRADEDDSDLNSMMTDMLKHLKASNPQTDVKEVSSPSVRSAQPPPVPPKQSSTPQTSAPAATSADPRACGRCGKAVDEYGDTVQAMDRKWHPACFVCYSCRGELLGPYARGGGFYPRNGQPHCTNCYRRSCGQ